MPALISFRATGPAHRCDLLGEPHLAHAAFAQSADELKPLGKELSRRQAGGVKAAAVRTEFSRRRRLQELGAQAVADREQCLELRAQLLVRRADLIEESGARLGVESSGLVQQLFDVPPTGRSHGEAALLISRRNQIRAVAHSRSTVANEIPST